MESLLAILNSRLITYYHRKVVPEADRVFAEVKIVDLEQIPFPRFEFATPASQRTAQLKEAKPLYEKSLADGCPQDALHFVEAELRAGRADIIHDLLAFLAERMITMNRERSTISKQFLTDLKDFRGIDVHSMSPKTKLDEFWKLEAADLFFHFRANRVRISQSNEENIRERFSKCKSALVPLDSQILFTDQLIDQIVYRLYGLTREEIKIVEGVNENR